MNRGHKISILISSLGLFMALGLFANGTEAQAQSDPINLDDTNVTLSSTKYAGTDGTSQWYISNDDVLHIKSGTLASGSLGKSLVVDETKYSKVKFADEKQDIKRVIFDGNVYLPQDSSWLFTGLGNNLDGTCGLIEIKNADRLNTSNVKDMSHMFDGLSSLKSVDVSTWDVSGVMDMSYMFNNTGLATINVANWDTGNVLSMKNMFSSNPELESLDISNWNVVNVKNMSAMFMRADQVKTLNIANWNIINVEKMNHMFSGAKELKELDFSRWDNKRVKTTGLLSETNLKRIVLSPNFSLKHSYLGQDQNGNDNLQTWLITDRNGNKRVVKSKQLIKARYVGIASSAKNLAVFDVNIPNNLNQHLVNRNVKGTLKNGIATLTIKIPQKSGYKVNKRLITFTVNVAKLQPTKGRYIVSSPERVTYTKSDSKGQTSSVDHLVTTLPDKKVEVHNDDVKKTADKLAPQTNWLSDKSMKDGSTYCRVATNKWVKDDEVYVYQPQTFIVQTGNQNNELVDAQGQTVPQRNLSAQTSWRVDRLAYLDGKTYYRVATNEFVPTTDVTIVK